MPIVAIVAASSPTRAAGRKHHALVNQAEYESERRRSGQREPDVRSVRTRDEGVSQQTADDDEFALREVDHASRAQDDVDPERHQRVPGADRQTGQHELRRLLQHSPRLWRKGALSPLASYAGVDVRILSSLLTAAALVVLPQMTPAAPSGQPIVVGAILSITGIYAPLGEPESKALQLAEKDINAHGGIAGRPLHILIQDDEGKADTAAQLATGLSDRTSPRSSAVRSRRRRLRSRGWPAPRKSCSSIRRRLRRFGTRRTGVQKYIFEVTPRNEIEAAKLLSFTKTKLHAKKVALLHDDAPYGTAGAAVATDEAHRQGLDVADDEAFPITSTDVTAQLGRIKASGADAIVIWTASPVAALAVRQIRQLGLNPSVVGSTGIVSDNFLRIAGKDGDGVYSDMDLDVTHPNAAQRAFMAAYRGAYAARPNNFASFVWDAAHLAALALTQTHGNADGDALSAALISMKPYSGSTGTYKFSEADHNGMSPEDVHIAVDHNAIWFTL